MRLKSLTLKGFKSFPDRTRLDFGPGVSVVVGPNGSGKSNVTDAVLWAMGEQSPLAVRGQSMQDVIFGGGRGVQARSAAEVEIVLDNSDGTVDLPLSEISIVRRLDRTGEGEYRLNGARCRLTDVIEVLSDTGLGKETHSVISQGRVEAIVTSKPRDRRLLIEEAAGLGKHRKRRRRAQLKLERTQENLDRALDVEREARTRLRPLKRQAEAAELHERLERQILRGALELARDDAARAPRCELDGRRGARRRRRARRASEIEARAAGDDRPARRGRARAGRARRAPRRALAAASTTRARRASALALRAEQVGASAQALARADRAQRARAAGASRARAREAASAGGRAPSASASRALEAELAEIEAQPRAGDRARARRAERDAASSSARSSSGRAARGGRRARGARARRRSRPSRRASALRAAERAVAGRAPRGRARRRGAGRRQPVPARPRARRRRRGRRAAKALSEELRVAGRLRAGAGGRARRTPGRGAGGGRRRARRRCSTAPAPTAARRCWPSCRHGGALPRASAARVQPPVAGRARLLELLSGPPRGARAGAGGCSPTRGWSSASRICPTDFAGIAATRQGRVWFAAWGEVRQLQRGRQRAGARAPQRTRPADRRRPSGRRRPSTPRAARGEQALEQAARRRRGARERRARAARGRAPARRGGRGSAGAASG